MPSTDAEHAHAQPAEPAGARRRAWIAAALLIGLLLLARVAYLAWLCPYDLIEDEAFYWLWAKHPAWSYQTKGPGIAWSIWLATTLLGDSAWAIRTVAAVAAAVAAAAAAGIAIDLSLARNRAQTPGSNDAPDPTIAALLAVGLLTLVPAYQVTALLTTIDGPYIACWMLASWAALRALAFGSRRAWIALGAAMALGFIFKYTILLILPGLVLAAWLGRAHIRPAPRWRSAAAAGTGLLLLGLLPVIIWNAQHDWVTVKHLIGHLNLAGGDQTVKVERHGWGYQPKWTLEYLGAQLGMIGPALLIAAIAAWRTLRARPGPGGDPASWTGAVVLVALGLPLLAFYLLVTFVAPVEMNWPIAAYTTLLCLGAVWLAPRSTPGRAHLWRAAMIYGLVSGIGMLRADIIRDAVAYASPSLAEKIPTGRAMSARPFAASIQTQRDLVAEKTGATPFLLTAHYGRAAQLAFYLPDHPVVYCASSRIGGRIVQQDYWADTSLDDKALIGRTAIIIGPDHLQPAWSGAFEQIDKLKPLVGEHKKDYMALVGRGFKGLPKRGNP